MGAKEKGPDSSHRRRFGSNSVVESVVEKEGIMVKVIPYHHCAPDVSHIADYSPDLRTAYCYSCKKVIDLMSEEAKTMTNVVVSLQDLRRMVEDSPSRDE